MEGGAGSGELVGLLGILGRLWGINGGSWGTIGGGGIDVWGQTKRLINGIPLCQLSERARTGRGEKVYGGGEDPGL